MNHKKAGKLIGEAKAPSQYIAHDGSLDKIKSLFFRSVALNAISDAGSILLHHAIESGNLVIVRFLIRQKLDMNFKDKFGAAPLHYAV